MNRNKKYHIDKIKNEMLIMQSLDDARWRDTLVALESVKSGKSVDEEYVNSWLDSWGTGCRKTFKA